MKRLVGAIAVLMAAVSPAAAQAPGLLLKAVDTPTGHIGLTLSGPAGSTLAVSETTGKDVPLGNVVLDARGKGGLPDAGTWRCDPRRRAFHAEGLAPDGTALAADADVRTPSCAGRYGVQVTPKRPRANTRVSVRLTDRFKLGGVDGKACLQTTCVPLFLGEGKSQATARLPVRHTGRQRVSVRVAGQRVGVQKIRIRRAKHINLLATGDSMIQIIDGFMKTRLAPDNVSVRSDARISTGLSKPFFFNWPKHAKQQATDGADVTVMFIGANDGFPFGSVQCCGSAWIKRYASIVSHMMSTYARDGAGIVYWCLLPAPRAADFRRVFVAVNHAARIAARRHPDTAHLIDFPKTFTPGFHFQQNITVNGRSVSVRQDDGVHFNVAGASIAASIIIRRMRRDGVI